MQRNADKLGALFCASVVALSAGSAQARVELVALPERARVDVSLDNPTPTLVEEERLLKLQKGGKVKVRRSGDGLVLG